MSRPFLRAVAYLALFSFSSSATSTVSADRLTGDARRSAIRRAGGAGYTPVNPLGRRPSPAIRGLARPSVSRTAALIRRDPTTRASVFNTLRDEERTILSVADTTPPPGANGERTRSVSSRAVAAIRRFAERRPGRVRGDTIYRASTPQTGVVRIEYTDANDPSTITSIDVPFDGTPTPDELAQIVSTAPLLETAPRVAAERSTRIRAAVRFALAKAYPRSPSTARLARTANGVSFSWNDNVEANFDRNISAPAEDGSRVFLGSLSPFELAEVNDALAATTDSRPEIGVQVNGDLATLTFPRAATTPQARPSPVPQPAPQPNRPPTLARPFPYATNDRRAFLLDRAAALVRGLGVVAPRIVSLRKQPNGQVLVVYFEAGGSSAANAVLSTEDFQVGRPEDANEISAALEYETAEPLFRNGRLLIPGPATQLLRNAVARLANGATVRNVRITRANAGYSLQVDLGDRVAVEVIDSDQLLSVEIDPSRAAFPAEEIAEELTREVTSLRGRIDTLTGTDRLFITRANVVQNGVSPVLSIVYYGRRGGLRVQNLPLDGNALPSQVEIDRAIAALNPDQFLVDTASGTGAASVEFRTGFAEILASALRAVDRTRRRVREVRVGPAFFEVELEDGTGLVENIDPRLVTNENYLQIEAAINQRLRDEQPTESPPAPQEPAAVVAAPNPTGSIGSALSAQVRTIVRASRDRVLAQVRRRSNGRLDAIYFTPEANAPVVEELSTGFEGLADDELREIAASENADLRFADSRGIARAPFAYLRNRINRLVLNSNERFVDLRFARYFNGGGAQITVVLPGGIEVEEFIDEQELDRVANQLGLTELFPSDSRALVEALAARVREAPPGRVVEAAPEPPATPAESLARTPIATPNASRRAPLSLATLKERIFSRVGSPFASVIAARRGGTGRIQLLIKNGLSPVDRIEVDGDAITDTDVADLVANSDGAFRELGDVAIADRLFAANITSLARALTTPESVRAPRRVTLRRGSPGNLILRLEYGDGYAREVDVPESLTLGTDLEGRQYSLADVTTDQYLEGSSGQARFSDAIAGSLSRAGVRPFRARILAAYGRNVARVQRTANGSLAITLRGEPGDTSSIDVLTQAQFTEDEVAQFEREEEADARAFGSDEETRSLGLRIRDSFFDRIRLRGVRRGTLQVDVTGSPDDTSKVFVRVSGEDEDGAFFESGTFDREQSSVFGSDAGVSRTRGGLDGGVARGPTSSGFADAGVASFTSFGSDGGGIPPARGGGDGGGAEFASPRTATLPPLTTRSRETLISGLRSILTDRATVNVRPSASASAATSTPSQDISLARRVRPSQLVDRYGWVPLMQTRVARREMRAAITRDRRRESEATIRRLEQNPADEEASLYDTLIIGSGPAGAAVAHGITSEDPDHRVGIIEAADILGANFGPLDDALAANSRNDAQTDIEPTRGHGNLNPMPGPFAPPDATGVRSPLARAIADSNVVAIHTAGARVIMNATATAVDRQDPRLRYGLSFVDRRTGRVFRVAANRIVNATGLNRTVTNFEDAATNALVEQYREQVDLSRPEEVPAITVAEDALRYAALAEAPRDPYRASAPGRRAPVTMIVGFGDNGRVLAGLLHGSNTELYDGDGQYDTAQRGEVGPTDWLVGPDGPGTCEELISGSPERDLRGARGRYAELKSPVQSGRLNLVRASLLRVRQISSGEDDGRFEVTIRNADGSLSTRVIDRLVLATGQRSEIGNLYTSFDSLIRAGVDRAMSTELAYAEGIAVGRQIRGEDIFFSGPSAGPGVVPDGRIRNLNENRAALNNLQEGNEALGREIARAAWRTGRIGRALADLDQTSRRPLAPGDAATFESRILRRGAERAMMRARPQQGPRRTNGLSLALKTRMADVLDQFRFIETERSTVTIRRSNTGEIRVLATGLSEAAVNELARAISLEQELVELLEGVVTRDNEIAFRFETRAQVGPAADPIRTAETRWTLRPSSLRVDGL